MNRLDRFISKKGKSISKELDKKNVQRGYIELIKDMYEGAVNSVKTTCGETGAFAVTIGSPKPLSLYTDYA